MPLTIGDISSIASRVPCSSGTGLTRRCPRGRRHQQPPGESGSLHAARKAARGADRLSDAPTGPLRQLLGCDAIWRPRDSSQRRFPQSYPQAELRAGTLTTRSPGGSPWRLVGRQTRPKGLSGHRPDRHSTVRMRLPGEPCGAGPPLATVKTCLLRHEQFENPPRHFGGKGVGLQAGDEIGLEGDDVRLRHVNAVYVRFLPEPPRPG